MLQKRAKAGKKIAPTPGFEPRVTRCLVGATLSSPPGGMNFLPKVFILLALYSVQH